MKYVENTYAMVDGGRASELVPREFWTADVPLETALSADTASDEYAVPVYANHGRWVVQCPDCRGAQITSSSDRRFMCCTCANVAVGGLWRTTTWPKDWRGIGNLLDARPDVTSQNWEVGEPLSQIEDENQIIDDPDLLAALKAFEADAVERANAALIAELEADAED